MDLTEDHGPALAPAPELGLGNREPGGVVAPPDGCVVLPAPEALVVAHDHESVRTGVPQGVRVPCLDGFVTEGPRQEGDEPPVVERRQAPEEDLRELRKESNSVEVLLAKQVIHGGDAPARRHELALPPSTQGSGAECPLDPADRNVSSVELLDGDRGERIGIPGESVDFL